MSDTGGDHPHDEIAQLETRIETLSESIERCRKISIVSKLAIAVGAGWLALRGFGIVPTGPAGYVISIATVIGGIVSLGSNSSSWDEVEEERNAAELRRDELIGQLDMRLVENRRRLH
jgi:hypothetical protein